MTGPDPAPLTPTVFPPCTPRRPRSEADLRYWLDVMAAHGYTPEEAAAATGLDPAELAPRLRAAAGPPPPGGTVRVLPYPGGRHPRLGFRDGAVDPQRETKFSLFLPWAPRHYVVADIPEAIFADLGLLYLAHTHVPTLWDLEGVRLPPTEWRRGPEGRLELERTLPNQIAFGTRVHPRPEGVAMELWLRNGTERPLTRMRVQQCVMLGFAPEFTSQTNHNKVFRSPWAACRSADGTRWVVTAWEHCQRAWGNPPCPCLHSDPALPDCPPGETRTVRGWLSFFEGTALDTELLRLAAGPVPWAR